MATVDSRPERNSGSEETSMVMGFFGFQPSDWLPAGAPHMTRNVARAGLTGLDIVESWLTASRRMTDLWNANMREQQDSMFASWRQIVGVLTDEAEAPSHAGRQPLTRAAVTKPGDTEASEIRH